MRLISASASFMALDRFFVFTLAQLFQAPIVVHARMQKVLIDRDQFIGKDFVELLDDCRCRLS